MITHPQSHESVLTAPYGRARFRDRRNPPQAHLTPPPAPHSRVWHWRQRARRLQHQLASPAPSARLLAPLHRPPARRCHRTPAPRRSCSRGAHPRWSRRSWPLLLMIVDLHRVFGDLRRPRPACAPASPARNIYDSRWVVSGRKKDARGARKHCTRVTSARVTRAALHLVDDR